MVTDATIARHRLVDALVRRGVIRKRAVAEALGAVPRHVFLPLVPPAAAYADEAVVTKSDAAGRAVSSCSQPTMIATMLGQLRPEPGQRVLEIGAGTGYNAALLRHLVGPAGTVVTVDLDADIVDAARRNLAAAGVDGVEVVQADGADGWPPGAPYDRIILTVGADDLSPAWVYQLAPDGRLVVPLGFRGVQASVAFVAPPAAASTATLVSDSAVGCGFVRLRGSLAVEERAAAMDDAGEVVLEAAQASAALDEAWLRAAFADVAATPGTAVATDVMAAKGEATDGLGLWLGLREPAAVTLLARGGAARSHGLPALVRRSGLAMTCGLAVNANLALLDWQGGELIARGWGPAPSAAALAKRLAGVAQGWDAAGRPLLQDFRIAAWVGTPAPAGAAGLGSLAADAPAEPGEDVLRVALGHAVLHLLRNR